MGFFIVFMSFTAFFKAPLGATCTYNPSESWHWIALSLVDTVQTVLLVIMAVLLSRKLGKNSTRRRSGSLDRNEMLTNTDEVDRFIKQVILLTVFYFIATLF